MAIRTRHTITSFEDSSLPMIRDNFDSLSSRKIESLYSRDISGASGTDRTSTVAITPYLYQSVEYGTFQISAANGSQAICSTFILKEKYESILYAQAHARHTKLSAHVISLVSSTSGWHLSIETRAFETATFSGVTTACVTVSYQVVGAPLQR